MSDGTMDRGRRPGAPGCGNGRRRGTRRGGFTLVELLMVGAIVGVLTGLALPNLRTVLMRARAAEVAGDMDVVRVATQNYNADHHEWPAEAAAGVVPPELVPYLPDGYVFSHEGYDLDFENWNLPGGLPGDPGSHTLVGVSVVVADVALGNALIELLGNAIIFSVGSTHTVVIDRS